jgi:Quinohemoprotein amine dehydrogenase, gamma subunit
MKHLKAINAKAVRMEEVTKDLSAAPRLRSERPELPSRGVASAKADVVALQQQGGPPQQPEPPHIPVGCSLVFSPGWEADRNGGTAGLCQPVERDLFDCHMGCFWPAQVPDQLNHAPDWTAKCAAAQKDWRKIDLIFPDKK